MLTVAALDVLLVISSMVALNAALPDIARETAATQTQLTWVVDGYTLVLACLLLPAGALGDRYGRRGALLVGLAIFSLASIAPVFLDSPVQIIVARAVAGVGAAFIMPATLSLLTAAFPKSERNKAVGIWAGVASSGAIFGFMGTGLLLNFFSWQSIFYAFAAAGLLMFVATCTISSSRDETATAVDWVGAVLIGAAVAVFVFGVIEAPVRGWTHPVVWGAMAAGVLLAVAFVVVELRRSHPLLDVRLFSRPEFATGSVGITILFFTNFGFFFIAMQYMQLILGYSPLQTAFALTPIAVPIMVLGATMHLYLPKIGLRTAVALGLFLIGAGLFCMRYLDAGSTYLGPRVALPHHQHRYRLMCCTNDFGDHERRARRETGRRVGGQRHDARSGRSDRHRGRGVGAGRRVQQGPRAGACRVRRPCSGVRHSTRLPRPWRSPARWDRKERGWRDLAETAFIESMDLSLMVVSVVSAVAAAFVALWAPGRDGEQFRFVQRLTARRLDDELGGPVTDHHDGGVRTAAGDGGKHRAVDHP